MRGAAAGCLVLTLSHNTQAEILAVYSFTNAGTGQTNNFTNDVAASNLTVSTLTTHSLDVLGVVTNFVGTTDNNGYGSFFDGKGFEARAGNLVDGGTVPAPTNNYAEFTLTPTAGHAVMITNVSVDFGLDDPTSNAPSTVAQYDLYLSLDGTSFTQIDTTSSHLNTGKTYPGYTIRNDVSKAITGFSGSTNTFKFRLAFADSNSTNMLKRVFFDDVVVSGRVVPTVELQLNDAIAYERDTNLLAQFSFVRMDTNSPLTVYFVFTESNLTNGAATFGVDYKTTLTNLATFASGEKKKNVLIRPVDDHRIEPPESITLTLLASSNYVVIGPTNGVAVLYDDEKPRLGVCFSDTFDTPDSSTNWTQLDAQRGGSNQTPLVVFGYDYVAAGIPPAPGITTNLGLKLGFTNTSVSVPAVVNLFHTLSNCSTDRYELSFDLYLQYNATNSVPQHAMAGINADPTNVNYIFQAPLAINGSGQFVTLVGNDDTNTAISRVQLWAPGYSTTNAFDNFPPGPTVDQLLNNPPYGANGGSPGVLGCDVNSTNKTWLHCQLIQLGDLVRLKINGYTALEAIVTNAQSPFVANGITPASSSLSYGAIMLDYLRMYGTSSPDHFAVFDNVEVIPLDGIALTSMAIEGTTAFLNFYSEVSSDFHDYAILSSTNLENHPVLKYPLSYLGTIPVADSRGFFGALLIDAFTEGANSSRFFQVRGTNSDVAGSSLTRGAR
jgi:hypothetical protein